MNIFDFLKRDSHVCARVVSQNIRIESFFDVFCQKAANMNLRFVAFQERDFLHAYIVEDNANVIPVCKSAQRTFSNLNAIQNSKKNMEVAAPTEEEISKLRNIIGREPNIYFKF